MLCHVEGNEDFSSFEELEQGLLNPLAADVSAPCARPGSVIPPRDLIDLVDENDALLDGKDSACRQRTVLFYVVFSIKVQLRATRDSSFGPPSSNRCLPLMPSLGYQ